MIEKSVAIRGDRLIVCAAGVEVSLPAGERATARVLHVAAAYLISPGEREALRLFRLVADGEAAGVWVRSTGQSTVA